MLKRLKKNYFLLIVTFLIIYFFFNLLEGNRGLISYFEKKQVLNDLKKQESILINQINDLDFKNSLLSDNLDLDYIEILIGSNSSNFPGLPVLTSQKAHALVHVSPIIINVACFLLQHSVIFGQFAS